MTDSLLSSVEEALHAYAQGQMVIVVDDEDRENEGDLVLAADFVTPQAINFMVTHARGLVCLAMRGALLDRLPDTHDGAAGTESQWLWYRLHFVGRSHAGCINWHIGRGSRRHHQDTD